MTHGWQCMRRNLYPMKVELGQRIRVAWTVLKRAGKEYGRDKVSRMAAAVSYRTVFAVVPMLVVVLSVTGLVVGDDAEVKQRVAGSISELAGQNFATSIDGILDTALEQADGLALFGFLVLLWSGSTLFLELQRDLNEIFEVDAPVEKRFLLVLLQRGIGFVWTLGIGVSLLALFAFNALWQTVADVILNNTTEGLRGLISVGGPVISFIFMVGIFGLVFQTMTIEKLPWKPVWIGALFTAIIFTITGFLTGLYIQILGAPSPAGFASSLVVVLFLAYLLSSVFLFGAQVTQSYSLLVYSAGRDRHMFSEPAPDGGEEEQSLVSLSLSALAAFFIGLVLGRRNRSR